MDRPTRAEQRKRPHPFLGLPDSQIRLPKKMAHVRLPPSVILELEAKCLRCGLTFQNPIHEYEQRRII